MKNNEGTHPKMKQRQILVNKKQSNRDINIIDNNKSFPEYDNNTDKTRSNKPSNTYNYNKMSSKLYNQTNNAINSTTKKTKVNLNNNVTNAKKLKLSDMKGNKSHNLFFSSKNNYTNNLKGNISAYLSHNKHNIGMGTKLDISKSEIQYPLNYNTKEIKNMHNSYNTTNSSAELNNKEINLRVSLKYGNKNNKEKIKAYNIASPCIKPNQSLGKKLRQSMKNNACINKRTNKEIYSPDIIKYNNNVKDMKSMKNDFYTKRDYTFINTFNSCYNFYQKDELNSKRKNEINFNNTINQYDFYNSKNNSDENLFISDISEGTMNENKNKNYNYGKNTNSSKDTNIISSSRYNNDVNNEEIKFNDKKTNNIKKFFLSYQNDLIEEFCEYIEEYMLYIVKDNFETFINKLREYSKKKYLNFLLLKRLQTKTIKKNFYEIRDSSKEKANNSYLSSTIINNNNINNSKKNPYASNNISKEYIRRKTTDNFNNHSFYPGKSENTYLRKSQEKIILKNFDSFYNNNYDTNKEKADKEIRVSNEKYDTNLYIPKKYRHINNITANKNQIKKNISHNYVNINPYFTNIDKTKESSKILSPELYNNLSNDIDEEIIKYKLERNSNIKNKKNKNHNISCDNKHDSKYYIEKGILNKINSNDNNNSSMAMNIAKLKDNKSKPIYNKKKVKISQPNSKIYLNKQFQENVKQKIIHRNNNKNLKKEQIMNFNLNKKINNKNRNNNEHYGIMTLSSNASENSNNDIDIIQNEKSEFNIISPKIQNQDINPINKVNNNKDNDINIKENENSLLKQPKINNQKNELNKEQINNENGNNNDDLKLKEEKNNNNNDNINNNGNVNNDYLIKMSNGKKEVQEDIYNNEYLSREIIVKDVSTRDKRVNVFIKYIEDSSFIQLNNNNNQKKHLLIIFQTDAIYLPASYPSISEQRNDLYKSNKYYKNMNDKNHQNKMNKVLSSIIEEEEKSKAPGSVNNSISIFSDEEYIKNGNYSYFFIQSIKYFISFLNSILSDKKKVLYFSFFKTLKKIKNDSFLKGLMDQKKTQSLNRIKEDENKSNINTSGDIILYSVNDNLDVDINYFNETKTENINPKNKRKELNNKSSVEKYSTDNNFCLFTKDNLYHLNNSNKKLNTNLSMDNFYLNKNGNHKNDKNLLMLIINKTKTNKKIKTDRKDLKELEKTKNGQDDINQKNEKDNENKDDINFEYEKKVTIGEACLRLADLIYEFRISLIKYGIKSNKKKD